ncbi:WD domain, G-beta repeat family protein [Leishmania donovani]|uniref:WD domain, G-beta repeat family protein n=1 Tax=Leishmania donovani TaxID=5661 RepID=A0A504XUQ1_LEIDO|nr:WD domain, G-beta repeat family protein [Leishmania donovani]
MILKEQHREASVAAPALHREVPASSASPSKPISATPTGTQGLPSQEPVSDAEDAVVPIALLTSASLAQSCVQSEGHVMASRPPPPSGRSGNSLDGDSTAVSTIVSDSVAQQRPLVASAIVMPGSSAPWSVSGRCPSVQSFQSRATSHSTTVARGRTGSLSSQPAAALSSPRLSSFSHLRPLPSSKEADYLNLAHQRSFIGRFRCATPVVIRTPAAATSHELAALSTIDGSTPSHVRNGKTHEETAAASTEAQHAVDVPSLHAVAAGHPSSLTAPGRSPRQLGRRVSGSGASMASSGTAGPGAGRGRPLSLLNGARPRGLVPSSSASALVRSTGATASAGLQRRSFAAHCGLLAANMEPLVKSGLHTSLWLAQQDGGLEVRSMANPNQVLASLPRRDPRAVITSLTEVCGSRVVAGYTDGTLCVYDAVTMKLTAEHRAHTAAVTCLLHVQGAPRFSLHTGADAETHGKHGSTPTQSLLLTGSLDRSIAVWEAASMSYLHKLKGNLRSIGALAATATGGYAFSGSDDGTLRMWDAVQGDQLAITKEERANAVKRVSEMDVAAAAPLLQRLVVASTAAPAAAGHASISVSFHGLHRGETEAATGREVRAGKSAVPSPRVFQRPSLTSVPASTSGFAAVGPPRLSTPPAVADGRHHRFREGHSAIKKSSLGRRAGAHIVPVAMRGARLLAKAANGGGRVSSLSASPLMPSAEVGPFEPTETGMTSSAYREGSVLVDPEGGMSPLRGGLEQEAELEDKDDERAMIGSAAVAGGRYRDAGRRSFATSRTPRSLKRGLKKRAKGLLAKRGAGVASSNSGRAATKTKAKSASAAPAAGMWARHKKGAQKRTTKSATLEAESTPVRTRWLASSLEQRLESWLRLYQQRVLLSAASMQLTQRISAGYDAVTAFNWPIECAHTECVTALAVVEDRLLVSASRDATAKVFALPSGQYVRALDSSRRMPLSSVLYDASVGRLYTAFLDGGLAVYDTHGTELPLLSQMQSPYAILSSTFVQLRMTPMRRFVWMAVVRGEEAPGTSLNGSVGLSSVVMGAAQFDRTTMAHGPNQTATSYRVGQPSLRELNAAVSLQPLQQQRARNLAKQARQAANDMLEEMELSDMRRCGLVLEREYVRRQSYCVFARWRQWAQRRALRSDSKGAIAARAESCAMTLLGRYTQRWLNWTRARKRTSASEVLRKVQLQASEVVLLAVCSEVREGRRRVWALVADAMGRQQQITRLACAYSRWREFLRARQVRLRQCVSFNKLLLSMNASSHTPASCTLAQLTRKATRVATQSTALWLLTEKTQSSQAHARRRRCFDLWRVCARQRRRVAASAAADREWAVVEPLSSSLVQPWKLRRRYFALWQNFALYVTRSERLASERDTLGVEWATLQKTLEKPMSVRKLEEKLSAAESSMAAAGAEAKLLEARLEIVLSEVAVLRTEAVLNMLIAGYRIPNVVQAATPLPPSTASAVTEVSSMASLRRGSLASSASTGLSNGGVFSGAVACSYPPSITDADWTEEERAQRQEEDKVLFEVSAVLRALKGKAMQYDRDDKLLSTAHTLALRLPIYEPAHRAQASLESSTGRHLCLLAQQPRTPRMLSAWSVSNAKSGGSTAVPALSSVASAAQMWAAQPAEETYACLADAFTAVYANLSALLRAAALECGAPTRMVAGTTGATTGDDSTAHVGASWITQVPLKQRRVMIGEVLKLVTLFDSFTAHNDLPVECAGSMSKRGSTNTRAMPLCSLCSRDTATALLENASVLLELVDPHLWPRQIKLNHLQDAYAAAIADLNAAVSSAGFSDAAPHSSTVMTLNSAGSGEQGGSPAPTPLVMRPPALRLSDEVLQEARAAMLQHDTTTLAITNPFGPLSVERRTNRSASSVHSGLMQATPLSSADGYAPARVHSSEEPLNTSKSLEGGNATPTAEPQHLRHRSTSHHSCLGVSTSRSYTPRTATLSVAGAMLNGMLVKPYLGFRVNVNRDTQTLRRTTISIREVTPQYVNAEGEDVDGPAQVAGLQVGDQLVRFAGYAVTDLAAFNAVVSRHVHAGAELPVVILRSGEQLCKTIVVGSRAAADA